ncbi:MAG: alpha-L-fucosidase [Bacteroidota bacterium]|nr:alpha-L-fucosidase [Bacteroidota bacterium]
MKRRTLIKQLAASVPAWWLAQHADLASFMTAGTGEQGFDDGPFQPTWDSLQQYKTPDWFRDAKFGMWSHWGPQCQPEFGDWYAREMYVEGSAKYKYHLEHYGHPSVFGFKDVINEWKAELWNPEELLALYKNTGAKYFMALANHHDNFDLFDSKYQPWNSVKAGPKKDLIGGWAKAARNQGLHFAVSVHAAHAWSWYETAQRSDKEGKFAGVSYDGKLTKKEGQGKWWEGFDPQELYAQNHALSEHSDDTKAISKQWAWGNGVSVPDKAYCDKFRSRVIQLIDKYDPDMIYFDDTALPLWPVSNVGLEIAAHYYNRSIKTKGSLQAVINGKVLDETQRKCMVWDIERGQSNKIEPLPWQTDTCLGNWHYDKTIFENHKYKTAKTVIQTLVDVISKNGNLMLNVPVKGDGTIDDDERKVVEEIGQWMKVNSESIYATRPWKILGEGPALENAAPIRAQGFNEGKGKPLGATDIRFVTKGDALYATILGWPETGKAIIRSLSKDNPNYPREINKVEMLVTKQALSFERTSEGLIVTLPASAPALSYANVLKIV